MGKYRVAVWSTGAIGTIVVQTILRRADMELVGVWVHSPAKVGVDVGTLTGGEPVGLAATNDVDALIAAKPDCICYAASDGGVSAAAYSDYIRFLEAGINVVTVTTAGLVFPPAVPQSASLNDAALRGGATLYASGIEPGFAGDQLVLTLLTMSRTIRSVRAQEIFLYDTYPVEFMMRDVFGFGLPMSAKPIMSNSGLQQAVWGPSIEMIAHGLGVTLDSIRETYELDPTPRRLEVACGVIEEGTVGSIRMETIGVVDGSDAIVIEHINRMAPDLAPHWPNSDRDGTYRIIVDGEPSMQCDLTLGATPEAAPVDGMIATAMRIINAIPFVCDASPGLTSSLDLPLTLPAGAFDL